MSSCTDKCKSSQNIEICGLVYDWVNQRPISIGDSFVRWLIDNEETCVSGIEGTNRRPSSTSLSGCTSYCYQCMSIQVEAVEFPRAIVICLGRQCEHHNADINIKLDICFFLFTSSVRSLLPLLVLIFSFLNIFGRSAFHWSIFATPTDQIRVDQTNVSSHRICPQTLLMWFTAPMTKGVRSI